MTGGYSSAYLIGCLLVSVHVITYIFVWRQALQGKGPIMAIALMLPAFIVTAGLWIFLKGRQIVLSVLPNSSEFDVVCKAAGPHYILKPSKVVESIAYDWEPGTYPPDINYFKVDARGNVSGLRGGLPSFPAAIKFIEGRCCQYEGGPRNHVGPFVRHPNTGEYFGITELTADVLVTYKRSDAEVPSSQAGLKAVDITVTDRRDGQTLATLRYLLDRERRRGCGAVSNGAMDEQAFIHRAVGID